MRLRSFIEPAIYFRNHPDKHGSFGFTGISSQRPIIMAGQYVQSARLIEIISTG